MARLADKFQPRVAVIDDDASVARALTRLLNICGHRAESFRSAQQFLDYNPGETLDEEFKCLVVDVHMPGMSGLDLQAALKSRGQSTPIVFVTGAADANLQCRALAEGALAFLQKPFSDFELLSAIRGGDRSVADGAIPER